MFKSHIGIEIPQLCLIRHSNSAVCSAASHTQPKRDIAKSQSVKGWMQLQTLTCCFLQMYLSDLSICPSSSSAEISIWSFTRDSNIFQLLLSLTDVFDPSATAEFSQPSKFTKALIYRWIKQHASILSLYSLRCKFIESCKVIASFFVTSSCIQLLKSHFLASPVDRTRSTCKKAIKKPLVFLISLIF